MSNAVIVRSSFFVVLGAMAIYCLSPILTPFFLGALLAYLGDPVVSYLNAQHIPRTLGVVIVFLLVILIVMAAILLILPMVQEQIFLTMQKIPVILEWLQDRMLSWMNHHENLNNYFNVMTLKKQLAENSQKVGNLAGMFVKAATHSTFAMIDLVINIFLVPVVAFYLMRDWPKIVRNIVHILPNPPREMMCAMARQSDEVIGAFFRGQLLVMLGLAVIYSTGLWLIGLQVAIFVGLLSGLLAVVPYLGFTTGIIVASIAMYLQTHSLLHVSYVWGVYVAGQMAESTLLTPLLVGDRIGLHPVAVIFSVLAGGLLFGFLGVLLALPVAAVILVILKHVIANEGKHAVGP
jgi:predicted PurR-regulated permease PerM